MCVCVLTRAHSSTRTEATESLVGISSLLPSCGSGELYLGHQAWQPVPLPSYIVRGKIFLLSPP